jgi:HNH endonuclease
MRRAKLRRLVILVFECRCLWCARCGNREHDPDGRPWHLDRYIPGADGGLYEPDNVVLACAMCNLRRGARSPAFLLAYLSANPPKARVEGLRSASDILAGMVSP